MTKPEKGSMLLNRENWWNSDAFRRHFFPVLPRLAPGDQLRSVTKRAAMRQGAMPEVMMGEIPSLER